MHIPKFPFLPEFKQPMLNNSKTATSRTRKYGEKGDTFTAFGATFTLTDVERVKLGKVSTLWFKEEGFKSPEGFEAIWNKIHPRKGFAPKQKVWLHHFKRV